MFPAMRTLTLLLIGSVMTQDYVQAQNPCKTNCIGLSDGRYQSCDDCDEFLECSMGFGSKVPCNAGKVWDDNQKECFYSSGTCPYVETATSPTPPPAEEYGVCFCRGDPHCKQFDSNDTMYIYGSCKYILATDRCYEDGTFMVLGDFERAKPSSPKSFVESVTILFTDPNDGLERTIELTSGCDVLHNGTSVSLPFMHSYASGELLIDIAPAPSGEPWDKSDDVVTVILPNGVMVMWDCYKAVKVLMPPKYAGRTCGLCGDYDGKDDDRWAMGSWTGGDCPGLEAPGPAGASASDAQTFVNSWIHELDDGSCQDECADGIDP